MPASFLPSGDHDHALKELRISSTGTAVILIVVARGHSPKTKSASSGGAEPPRPHIGRRSRRGIAPNKECVTGGAEPRRTSGGAAAGA
jgi:hypothetical protein